MDNILRKPRQLTEEEFELIRTHPVVGDKILKPLRFLACEAKAVRHHHERYDGKGYPDGLKGDDIPLIARVVTVADAFDAMTSDRPYRSKRPLATALEEIVRGAGTQFDPIAADAFSTIPLARLEQISRHLDLQSVAIRRCGCAAGGRPLTESTRPKILVVDDAGPVVILCVNVLQALGYAIRAANRGETAARARPQGAVRPPRRRLQDARDERVRGPRADAPDPSRRWPAC